MSCTDRYKMEYVLIKSKFTKKYIIYLLFCFTVSNKWIHERGQEFRRQCGLKSDSVETKKLD